MKLAQLIIYQALLVYIFASDEIGVLEEEEPEEKFNFTSALHYLHKYGYLQLDNENQLTTLDENSTEFLNALTLFQEYFHLNVTRTLEEKTLKLMQQPRCGIQDEPASYSVSAFKWEKRVIRWHFVRGNQQILNIASRAFNLWARYTNLDFVHDAIKPNIVISFASYHHNHRGGDKCSSIFDGIGGVLGHAFQPYPGKETVEIHLDRSENWRFTSKELSNDSNISIFQVLVHEIGHALGIGHSDDRNSIMYALFFPNSRDDHQLKLSMDDIAAIRSLYGIRQITTKPAPTTTTETSSSSPKKNKCTTSPSTKSTENETETSSGFPDPCELRNLKTFLVVNDRMYIFYKNFVWIKKLRDENFDPTPKLLNNFLPFIPKNFSEISAVFQRPDGDISFIINNKLYNVAFPSFILSDCCNSSFFNSVKISAGVTTYTGRTFIFYDDSYVAEVSSCNMDVLSHGLIENEFPGIPSNFDTVFRYTNGLLYFFKNDKFYEFNEFTKELVRAGNKDLSIFYINCPNISLLEKLKHLLAKVSSYKSNFFS